MFAKAYFPAAYWPQAYWPESGQATNNGRTKRARQIAPLVNARKRTTKKRTR